MGRLLLASSTRFKKMEKTKDRMAGYVIRSLVLLSPDIMAASATDSIPTFETLYGTSTLGKTKVWMIQVAALKNDANETVGGCIRTTYGYDGGAMQTQERRVTVGKNIGKKNETTPLEQAIREARADWTKKREEYAPSATSATTSAAAEEKTEEKQKTTRALPLTKAKAIDAEVPAPMLAHPFDKRGKSIVFPCYVQPKLDGTRCVAIPGRGLFSRNRKAYPHLEHIRQEIDESVPAGMILDGELYSDELTFQEIVGLVKAETLSAAQLAKQPKIKYHVYDVIGTGTNEARLQALEDLFTHDFQYMSLVPTAECSSKEEMKAQHDAYVADGYEGIMLRNKKGMYKNARSADLQKYKEFLDEEFTVVGYKQGEGAEEGCVIWVCAVNDGAGKTFACRPEGSREDRQEQYLHGADYVGRKLTVKFQEWTDDGLPRFPVGLAIRDADAE